MPTPDTVEVWTRSKTNNLKIGPMHGRGEYLYGIRITDIPAWVIELCPSLPFGVYLGEGPGAPMIAGGQDLNDRTASWWTPDQIFNYLPWRWGYGPGMVVGANDVLTIRWPIPCTAWLTIGNVVP